MDKLLDLKDNVPGSLVGICVILTLHLFFKIVEFLQQMQRKKESANDQAIKDLTKAVQENTQATEKLGLRLNEIEKLITELPKLKLDLRRFYSAIKLVAGDKWPQIRDEILKDEEAL